MTRFTLGLLEACGYVLIIIGVIWGAVFDDYEQGAFTIVAGLAAFALCDRTEGAE